MDRSDLQAYLSNGVRNIVKNAVRSTLSDPAGTAFIMKFSASSAKASAKREKLEEEGTHVPPFLIASITSSCNLHCKGCYSRQNHATSDCAPKNQLSGDEWKRIFSEAEELGISFVLLAGGEPLMRRDVIGAAAEFPGIIFPIFTNGVFVSEDYFDLFAKHRNLVPVLSIEGDRDATDSRRGEGIYDRQMRNMERLKKSGVLFGTSVTVTKENLDMVMSGEFIRSLSDMGCRLVIFVEYVPADRTTADLAPDDADREFMEQRTSAISGEFPDMILLSFPGDEKSSGGCLAAGRGFFHINSHGDAEPCPFSPYSDTNIRDTTLLKALDSGLFRRLHDSGVLFSEHTGGCVLFQHEEFVKSAVK
ncbi:MAG: radical SAM protein [Ruminococcus sp.]|nr:radical SAM protein [Ruminococcus sp.]